MITVPVQPPFGWHSILSYLSLRCTPGVETLSADRYTRHTPSGIVSVEYDSSAQALLCSADDTADALHRIQYLFDTLHDPRPVHRAFRDCPVLGPRIRNLPGVRAPGCWEPFELCVRVILGQQVSVKAAHTLMGRLAARCPGLEPPQLADADLARIGLTGARLKTLRTFARRVVLGAIRFDTRWEDTAASLAEVPGIGPWTIEYLAIRLGRQPDAFPDTDLGLLRAAGADSSRHLRQLAETWRPYRAYAAMCLWTN